MAGQGGDAERGGDEREQAEPQRGVGEEEDGESRSDDQPEGDATGPRCHGNERAHERTLAPSMMPGQDLTAGRARARVL